MSEPSSIIEQPDPNQAGPWRNELQERLQRYKTRRGRRIEGAFTMRFPFPPPEPDMPPIQTGVAIEDPAPWASDDSVQVMSIVEEPSALEEQAAIPVIVPDELREEPVPAPLESAATEVQEEPFELAPTPPREFTPFIPTPRPRPRKKVIAFPQPTYAAIEARHRLADPIASEQLRILDVPEELQAVSATPFLDGLLDPAAKPAGAAARGLELPCVAAAGWKRTQASLLDLCLMLLGAMIFAGSAYRFLPHLAPVKVAAIAAAVVCVLLWAVYQYVFLVYAGETPGMKAAGIKLATFKGNTPRMKQRKMRVLSLYLSVLSVGMGVLWSLADVDSLCWHDRMSQTFPVPRN